MPASLGSRIARGAAWMVVFKLLDRSIGIVSVVILARLLVPADFGLVAIRKDLQLNREFQLLLTKRIGVFLVTISIALATRSYWALVLGTLAGSVGGVVLSYVFHPFRPRFDLAARGELLRFSKWMVFSNVINTLASRAADLVIGKSLGPGPLGLFNLAHEISNLPSTELSAPVNRAVYPGYAKIASDPSRLAAQFLGVLGLTA